jgi:hypothetical protein
MGRVMKKIKYYTDMEARYRKKADAEPAKRERHIDDADAWRRLADTARLVALKQDEMRDWFATLNRRVATPPTSTDKSEDEIVGRRRRL